MEKIRVLFYTDGYVTDTPDPFLKDWNISELKKLIAYKAASLAVFEFELINRHLDKQQLTPKLLSNYDEVWIFGVLPYKGEPYELNASEVAALKSWMDAGGGLFVTGDHSIPENADECGGNLQKFPNLGRSLGLGIKRAGEMRVWEGPPTACYQLRNNANTQVGTDINNLDDPGLDKDATPQTLLPFPVPPHRLFWWRVESGQVIPIQKFPDHGHEGALTIPAMSLPDWPAGSQPPVIAARGLDKRFPDNSRIYTLVLAYDGDGAKVGRIVADSSFHHYFNLNLKEILKRAVNGYPEPDSDLDQIAQYFANLAIWLAPVNIRQRMKWGTLQRVADHPEVFEAKGTGVAYLGKVAHLTLQMEISYSDRHRLVSRSQFDSLQDPLDEVLGLLLLGESSLGQLTPIEQEKIFGTVLQIYQISTWGTIPVPNAIDRRPKLIEALQEGLSVAGKDIATLANKLDLVKSVLAKLA